MIVKSHIRGGYRAAADYMKDIGQNEKTRLVQISDPDAKNLDEAFHNMWTVACNSKVKKPLHHISINPFKDERLTDEQVLKIVERCEEKYGYKHGDHQHVVIEHIKHGRQHFHVIWNRVSLTTGRPIWPGHHWKKSKQAAREMERELGIQRPISRRVKRMLAIAESGNGSSRFTDRNNSLGSTFKSPAISPLVAVITPPFVATRNPPPSAKSETPAPPPRPASDILSGMCEEQRLDFIAACEGRMTWREYFRKWGNGFNEDLDPR